MARFHEGPLLAKYSLETLIFRLKIISTLIVGKDKFVENENFGPKFFSNSHFFGAQHCFEWKNHIN